MQCQASRIVTVSRRVDFQESVWTAVSCRYIPAVVLASGSWEPGANGSRRHIHGGIFHARVRPQERITLRAIRDEARLRRHGISRYNKRWRSWAQQRVRQYQLPLPVTLTSDTALMSAEYITSCVQKAAALRKHDLDLWRDYSKRILELKEDFTAEQLGYIIWGYGKSSYLNGRFYSEFFPIAKERLPNFQSHALMSLMWCMRKVRWRDNSLLSAAVERTLENIDSVRPTDFIKVANTVAILGPNNGGIATALSTAAIPKLEDATAQDFRDAVHPIAIASLWSDDVRTYLLERFRRVFITARPHHLMKAYESAVMCRVHAPQVWHGLSRDAKEFYVRLSQRHIPTSEDPEPSSLHWDVSRHLADMGEVHRNAFRWGPFHVDIGLEDVEEDERRRCIMIDGPSAFFYGTDQYLPTRKMQHKTLTSLGWDVRRVRWDDWVELDVNSEKKQQFLEELFSEVSPPGADLEDRPEAPIDAVRMKFQKLREVVARSEELELKAKEAEKITFDI